MIAGFGSIFLRTGTRRPLGRTTVLAGITVIVLGCLLNATCIGEVVGSIDLNNSRTVPPRIISEALCTFPSDTQFIEYDHTLVVRNQRSYQSLRRKLDDGDLERLLVVLQTLGIDERQIEEQVIGMRAGSSLYGIVRGAFLQGSIGDSNDSSLDPKFKDRIFCPGERMCVAFFSKSLLAFADLAQLRRMIEAHQSHTCGASTPNRELAEFMKNTDPAAPVRGAALSGELNVLLANLFPVLLNNEAGIAGMGADLSTMAYSVTFDSTAHIAGILACNSRTAALLFASAVTAARFLSSPSAQIPTPAGSIALNKVNVASAGSIVTFRLETATELDR